MATDDFRRKLTAVLSADVVGYSRLMGEDEAATVKDLSVCRKIIADLVKQHRGRVVGSPGDNVLAEFASAVDAVQCAVAVQKELSRRNAEMPEHRRMEFRIGINIGDVIEEGEEIYGDGVNIAARLESLAEPGGICISRTAFDQIESKLPLGYEFMGEKKVKNIIKPVPAYKVLMEPGEAAGEKTSEKRISKGLHWKVILGTALALLVVGILLGIWEVYRGPIPPTAGEPIPGKVTKPLPEKGPVAVLPAKREVRISEEFPPVGTKYTYTIFTERGRIKRSFSVIEEGVFKGEEVRREAIIGRNGIKIYDKKSNNWMATVIDGEVVRGAKPHDGLFRFPLHVGKKYTARFTLFRKGRKRGRDITRNIEVAGFEKVKVPAGTFDAFKLDVKDKIMEKTYWYSPELKLWVKKIERHPKLGISTTELIEYVSP